MSVGDNNRIFYGKVSKGRDDYWRKMAAPRFRVETLLALLAERPPRSAVDLGCGGGQLLEEVARARPDARLVGVDLSEAQMAQNRVTFPGAAFFALDLDAEESLDGPLGEHEGEFDAVVAMELIEHVASPETLLRVALRLARPGGRLFLSTQSGPVRDTERRVGHRRHFTAEAMTALLVATGWAPERVWNAGFPFHDLSKRLANLDPDGAIDRFDGRAYGLLEEVACMGLRALFRLNSRSRGAQLFAVARGRGRAYADAPRARRGVRAAHRRSACACATARGRRNAARPRASCTRAHAAGSGARAAVARACPSRTGAAAGRPSAVSPTLRSTHPPRWPGT